MKHAYFPALDGLRCLAIAIVMLAHADVKYLRSGGIGVDIFFALSGFLITTILRSEFDRYGSIRFGNFYIRRFLRLLPAFVVAAMFVLVQFRLVTGEWPVGKLMLALGYVMNWAKVLTGSPRFPMGHSWSLAIEEQFYLVWPLIVTLICTATASKKARFFAMLSFALGVAVYRALMVGHYSAIRIYFGSDTHSDGLIMGAALAFFVTLLPDGRLTDRMSRVTAYVFSPLAMFCLAGAMVVWHWWDASMGRIGFFVVAVSSTMVILDLVAGSHSLLAGLFTLKPIAWLGKISYGLYLWHLPIYHAMDELGIPGAWATKLAIGAPLTVGIAALSYYTIEKKFLKVKDRFSRSVEKPKPAISDDGLPSPVFAGIPFD